MEKGGSYLKRHGAKIVMGIMFCILIFLGGMLFSINNKLAHFQAGIEERISELEERQNSIEQSLGFLKTIQPEIEGLHKYWESLRTKMSIIQGSLEKFIDELSESFSKEQKEKMKKAVNKLFRLWEAFGDLMEELEAEMKEGGQGEGSKD